MKRNEIASELRRIRHLLGNSVNTPVDPWRMRDVRNSLLVLERNLPRDKPEDYHLGIEGFDTVMSYIAREEPTLMKLALDPVRDHIADGKRIAHVARCRRLPVLKVDAPAPIKQRYSKIKTVNAYPTHLLAEYFSDGSFDQAEDEYRDAA